MSVELGTGFLTTSTASVGAAYSFTRAASANLREKDDHWNATIGGFFGGAVGGLKRKLPAHSLFPTGLRVEYIIHLKNLGSDHTHALLR